MKLYTKKPLRKNAEKLNLNPGIGGLENKTNQLIKRGKLKRKIPSNKRKSNYVSSYNSHSY